MEFNDFILGVYNHRDKYQKEINHTINGILCTFKYEIFETCVMIHDQTKEPDLVTFHEKQQHIFDIIDKEIKFTAQGSSNTINIVEKFEIYLIKSINSYWIENRSSAICNVEIYFLNEIPGKLDHNYPFPRETSAILPNFYEFKNIGWDMTYASLFLHIDLSNDKNSYKVLTKDFSNIQKIK